MAYKRPESVLVVIYAFSSRRVLMLQRRDDPGFWQSVTGSLDGDETRGRQRCAKCEKKSVLIS